MSCILMLVLTLVAKPEQVDAETQYRAEQARMNELQSQLDQIDQVQAGHDRK